MRLALARSLLVVVLLISGASAATAAAPNGVAAGSSAQIVAAARQAVSAATTVHVVGAGTSGKDRIALDLTLTAGQVGEGHISINGLGFDIVRIGDKLFFKGDPNFLTHYAGAAAASLLAGRWFYVAGSNREFASFLPLTNLVQLVDGMLSAHGSIEKGAVATVGGRRAIGLVDSTSGGTLYVATTGPAYPLELKPRAGGNTGTIRFSGWDGPVTVRPPRNPIDYAKLTHG